MASIPQLYSNYSFSNDFSQFPNPLLIPQCSFGCIGAVPSEETSFPMFLDNGGLNVFQQESNFLTSSVPAALFTELIGISSEMAVPNALPHHDNNVAGFCGIGTIQNFCSSSYDHLQDVCEFGEECTGFVHQDFKPVDPTVGQNWGTQGNRMLPAMEDNSLKVGRYSVEERKDRILRYLKKRNQRNFNKTIKYACRKTLADRRVRVRGRFARNTETELCEEEVVMKKEDHYSPVDKNMYCCDAVQIKHDEDEWLQEAMANLMYLPYIAG